MNKFKFKVFSYFATYEFVGCSFLFPQRHGGFCLETQAYPDAVNHDNFPGVILSAGQVYTHVCKYKFSCKK